MAYTNSSLVNHKRLSPNHSGLRNHAIDTITIHCAVGQCSVETLGSIFADSSREASSNYGVGYDGRIGMYVEEKNRSWCSSSSYNDNRAVTIEVASDTYDPYRVNDKALSATINLVADICKRNGIKKLKWSTSKNDRVNHLNGCNMTVHRDYANKSCPGDYLYGKMSYIADEVNKKLGNTTTSKEEEEMIKYGETNNATLSFKQHIRTLKAMGVISQGVDNNGCFGEGTLKAVKEIQKAAGITVDGIVGQKTINAVYDLETKAYKKLSDKIANAKKALN